MANLRIAELDFDLIKQNLKTYLQGQAEFTDYDFEGSGLSVLLDILSYNTHYNAYLANMVANEMFLDSAVKRQSAVSLAKHMGYVPRSTRAATATLDIIVNNPTNNPTTLTLDEYTTFNTTIGGTAYSFLTTESVTIRPSGGVYLFNDVKVYEGQYLSFNYTVESATPSERFQIPNDTVDTTTIKVTVQKSASDSTSEVYNLVSDVSSLDGTSLVYFLQEGQNGRYEIYFGDGVLGKQLEVGNIIRIEYISTSGSDANVSGSITQTFTSPSAIGGSTDIDITVVSNSVGGADKEGITSIKFNAPLVGASQNRAVTAADYEALIRSNFTEAQSVSVWGGEDNDPPIYGKVVISLKPYDGYFISDASKEKLRSLILQNKKALAIQPYFIDPEYFYVKISVNIVYNSNLTTQTAGEIQSSVEQSVIDYFDTEFNQFNKDFYYSKLINHISDINTAIVGVNIGLDLQKRITPVINSVNVYSGDTSIKYYNKIHPTEVTSTRFYVTYNSAQTPAIITDVPDQNPANYEGTGTLWLTHADTGVLLQSIGSVNYGTGVITITGLTPTGYPDSLNDISITCELQEVSRNIDLNRNQVIVLDDSTSAPAYNRTAGLSVNVTAIVQ